MPAKCAVLVAVLTFGALGATSTHAVGPSGLRGLVMRSPITPVCIQGIPCSAPAKNAQLVFFRGESTVKTRTDGTGHYRVALAPGSWNVRTAGLPRIGSGISPARVRVFAARVRVVNFDIDTGIR